MDFLKTKIPPPIVVIILAFLAANLKIIPLLIPLDFAVRGIIALFLILVGLIIDGVCIAKFLLSKTTINPMKPQNTTEFIYSGLYKYSRNPMYLGQSLILSGFCINFGGIIGLLAIPAFVLYMNKFQIIPEEQVLEQKFGNSYRNYKAKVRRWL